MDSGKLLAQLLAASLKKILAIASDRFQGILSFLAADRIILDAGKDFSQSHSPNIQTAAAPAMSDVPDGSRVTLLQSGFQFIQTLLTMFLEKS
jgi:hypothetical protein